MIGVAAIGTLLFLKSAAAQASLPPGPLEVHAETPAESTGTMHYASRVTIRWKDSDAEPIVLGADEDEPDLPVGLLIPGPNYAIAGNRALLLGWSSVGAGLQEIQALLIEKTSARLAIVDELHLQTDRASSAILVRRDGRRWRLGIFRPEKIVFDEGSWFLTCRAGSLDMGQIRRLSYVARDRADAELVYPSGTPPAPQPREVAWIEIGVKGYRLPTNR
jgi:hypothetical protein